jgi:CheY-like chemotaxis protein/HPt (histidine-containing phosphotransfer) domain-containing protein
VTTTQKRGRRRTIAGSILGVIAWLGLISAGLRLLERLLGERAHDTDVVVLFAGAQRDRLATELLLPGLRLPPLERIEGMTTPAFAADAADRISVTTGSLEGVQMFEELTEAAIPESGPAAAEEKPIQELHCSVLLAEDGIDNQVLIAKHLSRAGAAVTVVDDGRLAVDAARAAALAGRPFDVILMDIQMPELDGYAATSELRRRGYTGPIVALTAHAMAGDRERCVAAGCTDHLTKPIARGKLVDAVAHHARTAPRHGVPLLGVAAAAAQAMPAPAPRAGRGGPIANELADDPEMVELIDAFVAALPVQMTAAAAALRGGDRVTLQRIAHQLKGSGAGYGFTCITDAAAAVESAIRSGEPAAVAERFAVLADLCARAVGRVKKAA